MKTEPGYGEAGGLREGRAHMGVGSKLVCFKGAFGVVELMD